MLEREAQAEQSRKDEDQKTFFVAKDRLKAYDDDRVEEAGRDLWFTDRFVFSFSRYWFLL